MSTYLEIQIKGGKDAQTVFMRDIKSPDIIAQHVCAFLNSESGGSLICGIDQKGTPLGIDNAPDKLQELQFALAAQISPPALFSVTPEQAGKKSLIVVEVPSGPDKPYVAQGGVWLRKGGRTVAADAQSLRALFSTQAAESERWERRLSVSMLFEDLSEDEILRLRDEARRSGRFDFKADEPPEAVLADLSMTRPGGFTHCADVLFSTNPSLRHPQVRVQLVVFARDEASDDYDDFRWFEGPLLKIADEVVDALVRHNRIRSTFRPDEIERRDQPNYARYAIREGVVNALVHRDYSSYSGSVKISIYPSRIEIWNTGRLPDGIRPGDLARKHPSIPVNPDIAHAFYLRSFMDRVGRGGQRLAESCKEIGAHPPKWSQIHGGVLLTLYAAVGKEQARRELLNERQRTFIENVSLNELLTVAEYRDRFAPGITNRQARRDLSELESFRLVRREGAGPSTVYRRTED